MNYTTPSDPIETVASGVRESVGRSCLVLVGFTTTLLLIAVITVFWFLFAPRKIDVAVFNRLYDTDLSARQILYSESGFVDTDFCASIPMTAAEFDHLCSSIGMVRTSVSPSGGRAWWCSKPKGEYFTLDRIRDPNHRDRIEAHYESKSQKGYFHYFDT
jgi:hypothetical protein